MIEKTSPTWSVDTMLPDKHTHDTVIRTPSARINRPTRKEPAAARMLSGGSSFKPSDFKGVKYSRNMPRDGEGRKVQDFLQIEILTAAELAARLKVRESWIVEQTKPSRASDPIPTIRFGKHNRYAWGSKAFMAWFARRFASQ